MTHYSVLVIGDEIEQQLAPYDENLEVKAYRVLVTDEEIEQMVNYYTKGDGKEKFIAKYGKEPEEFLDVPGTSLTGMVLGSFGEDWNGTPYKSGKNGWYYWSTYNPKHKWDWYSIGGRWGGFWKLKPDATTGRLGDVDVFTHMDITERGKQALEELQQKTAGRADQALKKDIDFEGMEQEAEEKAVEFFDKVSSVLLGLEMPRTFEDIREAVEDDLDLARKLYRHQVAIKTLDEAKIGFFFGDVLETIGIQEEPGKTITQEALTEAKKRYVAKARKEAWSTAATLYRGEWLDSEGEGAYYGPFMVMTKSDEDKYEKYIDMVRRIVDALPDDTMLTIVDCHT